MTDVCPGVSISSMTSMPRCAHTRGGISLRRAITSMTAYSTRVRYDVRHISRAVDRARAVRALLGELGEPRDLQREALAVHDVPVELVDLRACS